MTGLLKDKRNFVIILLAALSILKIPLEGLRFAFWVLGGVFLCYVMDLLLGNRLLQRRAFAASPVISGFIVSGILDYQQPWFVLVIFCGLAIFSKHIVRLKQKHIFNPANFALFIAALFRVPLTWSIESNIALIVIFGLYLAYYYKKFFHIAGFLVFFIGLFALCKINAFGFVGWFFLFIMLLEPKTSGYGGLRGFIFGGIAGITCFLMFKFVPRYDAFISCLFVANLSRPLLEKLVKKSAFHY